MQAVLLDTKAATVDTIKRHQAATKECDRKLQVLRTENGGKFTAGVNEGIQRHFFATYTPLQNGVVEHRNQMVVATTYVLLK
jgi:hypothetical protein